MRASFSSYGRGSASSGRRVGPPSRTGSLAWAAAARVGGACGCGACLLQGRVAGVCLSLSLSLTLLLSFADYFSRRCNRAKNGAQSEPTPLACARRGLRRREALGSAHGAHHTVLRVYVLPSPVLSTRPLLHTDPLSCAGATGDGARGEVLGCAHGLLPPRDGSRQGQSPRRVVIELYCSKILLV